MARILVLEPHPEVRDLFGRIARRLGHDAVLADGLAEFDASSIDVVIVEPAVAGALERAQEVAETGGAAVVCVSIYPPSEHALGLNPVAYLLKPFSLVELERALSVAIGAGEPANAA